MNGRTSHDYLSRMIHSGMEESQCGLCHTHIQNYIEEVACPHWFLKNGARGFHLKRLARVFQVYDIDSVQHYLRVVAQSDARRSDLVPFRELRSAHERIVVIEWRKRRWLFQQAAIGGGEYAATQFTVSSYHLGQMIEKGRIDLVPGSGEVAVTPLLHEVALDQRSWEKIEQQLLGQLI